MPYNYTVLGIWSKIDSLCYRTLFLLVTQANCAGLRKQFCHIFIAVFPELHFANFSEA